jgi:hypothetical protein
MQTSKEFENISRYGNHNWHYEKLWNNYSKNHISLFYLWIFVIFILKLIEKIVSFKYEYKTLHRNKIQIQ